MKENVGFVSTGFSTGGSTLGSSTVFGMPKLNFGGSTGGFVGSTVSFGGEAGVGFDADANPENPVSLPNLNPPLTTDFSPCEISCDIPPNELCEGGRLN